MKLKITLLSLLVIFTISSCKKDDFKINGKFVQLPNDVIVLNEGQWGKSNGSFSYLSYNESASMVKINDKYADETQKGFGGTSCFAKRFGSTIYVVSKDKPFLSRFTSSNSVTFDFKDTIVDELEESEQAHSTDIAMFLTSSNKSSAIVYYNFLLTTTKNIYNVDINNKKIEKLNDTEKGFYDVMSYADEAFVITDDGLEVYNKRGFSKNLGAATGGFAMSIDENIWASNYDAATDKTELIKINPETLGVSRFPIDVNLKPAIWLPRPDWKKTPLIASTRENALFFLDNPDTDNYKLYKYDIKTNKVSTLIELDNTKESFTSSAIVYSYAFNEIIAVTKVPGWDFLNKNSIIVIDAEKGTIKHRVEYDGFYFPTMLVLNENRFQIIENE